MAISTLLPFDKIVYGTRLRAEYPNVSELADSIHENGIIHPMTVASEDSLDGSVKQYELIAGGRRYNAYLLLQDRHPGEYLNVPVTLRRIDSKIDLRLLELEENFRREDMTWQESALGIREFHNLNTQLARKRGDKWTQSMTGKLTGQSQANTSYTLTVANALFENDKEIWGCENLTAAVKLLLDRQVKSAQVERLRRLDEQRKAQADTLKMAAPPRLADKPVAELLKKPTPKPTPSPSFSDDEDEIPQGIKFDDETEVDISALGLEDAETELEKVSAQAHRLEESKELFTSDYLRGLYMHGDCIERMKAMKVSGVRIDHIITDPPYGIDMKNLDTIDNIDSVEATHGVEDNLKMFEPFLTAAFDLLPNHGFLAMWYDLDHHEKLSRIAKKVGFKVQRWPLVWCKTSPCINNTAQFNFTKATEVCLILRKSSQCILAEKQSNNFILEPNQKDARHPFAKPFRVWERLIKSLSLEGQVIFDPFAGSGSSMYASLVLNRLALGCEIDEIHIAEGVESLHKKLNETINLASNNGRLI